MLSTMEINIRLLNLLKEQLPEALHPPTHAHTNNALEFQWHHGNDNSQKSERNNIIYIWFSG